MTSVIDTTELARRFATLISETLGPARLAEVVRRNATSAYEGVCASHDFIDANDCLLAAMDEMSIKLETTNDAQIAALSEAWDMARAAGFQADAIHGPMHGRGSDKPSDRTDRERG